MLRELNRVEIGVYWVLCILLGGDLGLLLGVLRIL